MGRHGCSDQDTAQYVHDWLPVELQAAHSVEKISGVLKHLRQQPSNKGMGLEDCVAQALEALSQPSGN